MHRRVQVEVEWFIALSDAGFAEFAPLSAPARAHLRGLVDERQPLYAGVRQIINFGLDKLRFPNAVKAGSRVRAHCVLLKVEEVTNGLQMTEQYTVEIEGEAKPACVAEAIMRAYF